MTEGAGTARTRRLPPNLPLREIPRRVRSVLADAIPELRDDIFGTTAARDDKNDGNDDDDDNNNNAARALQEEKRAGEDRIDEDVYSELEFIATQEEAVAVVEDDVVAARDAGTEEIGAARKEEGDGPGNSRKRPLTGEDNEKGATPYKKVVKPTTAAQGTGRRIGNDEVDEREKDPFDSPFEI